MFTLLLTGLFWLTLSAVLVTFFNALEEFFQDVIRERQRTGSIFKALKVLIKNKWGRITTAVLVEKPNQTYEYDKPTHETVPVPEDDIKNNKDIMEAFAKTTPMSNGDKIINVAKDK